MHFFSPIKFILSQILGWVVLLHFQLYYFHLYPLRRTLIALWTINLHIRNFSSLALSLACIGHCPNHFKWVSLILFPTYANPKCLLKVSFIILFFRVLTYIYLNILIFIAPILCYRYYNIITYIINTCKVITYILIYNIKIEQKLELELSL